MANSAAMQERRLVHYPYVKVRLACERCRRSGEYRLARLAAKYGADIDLDELLYKLTVDCEVADASHPFRAGCYARFVDLDPPRRPPDGSAVTMKLVRGGKG
jgi:hypothetical protein